MSRFLFVMWEGGGTIPPEMALAGRLVARDHEVVVLGDPTIEREAKAAGCGFRSWDRAPHRATRTPESDPMRDWEIKNPLTLFKKARDTFLCGPAADYAADTMDAIHAVAPDVLVPDAVLLGAVMAGEAASLPTAAMLPSFYMFPRPGTPPIGMGLPSKTNALTRARNNLIWRIFIRMFDSGRPAINAARAGLGLDPVAHVFDHYDNVNRFLVMTSALVDRPGPIPPNVRYTGIESADPSWATAERWTPPWPADDHRPLVLVMFSSTYQAQEDALGRIITALGQLPVRGLVTLGPALDAPRLPAADNVAVIASAPHAAILPECAAVVTHCGHGSMAKAMAYGVPIVALPMGRDQGDNAQRVKELGVGIRLKLKAKPEAIAAAVDKVIKDSAYAEAALRLQKDLDGEHDRDGAVDELEALAALTST